MIGANGKNSSEKLVIIYDFSVSIEQIRFIQKTNESIIIPLNFQCFQKLEENNIPCVPPDEFLTREEMKIIQESSYELSDWYLDEKLEKILEYENVNIGSTIQSEFINIIVNFLREFCIIEKIVKRYSYSIICSSRVGIVLQQFTDNFSKFETTENQTNLPLDSLSTNIELKFGGKKFGLKIGKKRLNSLKSITEKFSNSLVRPTINPNSKFFLFSEINTKKFSSLFLKMSEYQENFVVYNRRQPSIWDKESLFVIKNSNVIIENEKTLNQHEKIKINERKKMIDEILFKLKDQNSIFEKKFTIFDISFWDCFKDTFFSLLEKRFFDHSYEIELSNELLDKHTFNAIVLQNEIGPHEQILLQLGKLRKIPILLLQHGLIFDTNEGYLMNKYQGVLGLNSDYQLVWGTVDYQYREKLGFDIDKIIKIGSPIYDKTNVKGNLKKNYVLLATSGPTTEDVFDLTVETNMKNIETIKKISEIMKKLNQKLIIKIHPSPDEYDPTDLVKRVDDSIEVIKTGDISEIIKNCVLMIVIDFSSVILDGYLLKKPIISIPVKDNNYGLPTALTNESCIISKLEDLEQNIEDILKKSTSKLVENEKISCHNYLSNPGNSSQNLLDFLSTLKISH